MGSISLISSASQDSRENQTNPYDRNLLAKEDEIENQMIRESRVSKKFQEMTTKRVVSIVLICIMCTPFLAPELYLYDFGNKNMQISDYLITIMRT